MARLRPDEFAKKLQGAYGSALRAVVLYGSAAGGEYLDKRSDFNVLVIAEPLTLAALRAAAAVTRRWVSDGNPPPLSFTAREWRTSADTFPMEYADMLERHRVLIGENPFDGISIDRAHLRLQLEREAMGRLLALRQGVLAAGDDTRESLSLLEGSLSGIMVLFRAVMRVHGATPPADNERLSRDVATLAGFDATPFVRAVRHVREKEWVPDRERGDVVAGYLIGIERLVAHLDQLLHGARA